MSNRLDLFKKYAIRQNCIITQNMWFFETHSMQVHVRYDLI